MKTMTVDDGLYAALQAAANRSGRPLQELANEAIRLWLADSAADEADHAAIESARAEAAEQGGVEFEAFFEACRGTPTDSRSASGRNGTGPRPDQHPDRGR